MKRMKRTLPIALTVMILLAAGISWLRAQPTATTLARTAVPIRLAVLWTSADPEVAHRVCLMYSHAAGQQRWFDEVLLVVWGPSARLLAADKDLQAKVKSMLADGIKVQACVVCADSYGVTARLRELGVDVKPMGGPLTEMLKSDWKVLTF
jgi:hypothetical protein